MQAVEIEIVGGDYTGIPFVLRSDRNWIKNGGSDFYVEFDSETTQSVKVSSLSFLAYSVISS